MLGLRRWSFIPLTLALWSLAPDVGAQTQPDEQTQQEARRLYSEARDAMRDKKYREAALGFEAASRLHPHAVALYTAAQAWELAGEPGRAADAYALALATPKLSENQAQRSRERLAELEKQVGTLVIVGSEGTRVQLGDNTELGVPARLHGKPGEHVLTITRPGDPAESRSVKLVAGESIEIDAEASAEKAPEQPKAEAPKPKPLPEPKKQPVIVEKPRSNTLRTIGFVTAGAGVAAIGGGLVLGMSAKDAEDTYAQSPTRATYDHAKSLETRTNIMLIAGGVLTAAGVGIVIWQSLGSDEKAPPNTVQIGAGAGSLWAQGSF